MLTRLNKILMVVGFVFAIIIVIPLLYWEKTLNRYKKTDVSLDGQGMVVRPKEPTHPCSERYKQADWEQEINFCYNTTRITKQIMIPVSTFQTRYRKEDPSKWKGYDFYLDSHSHNTRDSWWGDTFITTSKKWPRNSYGWTPLAHKWKRIITNLTVTNHMVHMTIDSSKMPLSSQHCAMLRLCAWARGTDPCWEFRLCPLFMKNTAEAANTTGGNLTPVGGQDRTKNIVIVEKDLTTDDWFRITTGISRIDNNWLLMVEQAASTIKKDCVVCLGARPLLQVVPSALGLDCLTNVMNNTVPSPNCTQWDEIYPLTTAEKRKPVFSKKVAPGNFTCIDRIGNGIRLGKLNKTQCGTITTVDVTFKPKARSDIWWWCGDDRLFDRLPYNTTGYCASVTLILPVAISPITFSDLMTTVNDIRPHTWKNRQKRSKSGWSADDPTYIDSIGVPRGVPDEYKLADQVAAGFESFFCWWCTINKNIDRINYIHYNVQRLGNKTAEGFSAIHEQLSATSLMAFQNRIAVDMLLAEKGGVCSIFGDQCCTFIPNNTAADGSLTKALEGLRSLNSKMKDHSGVDTTMWDSFGNMFGQYKQLAFSVLMSVAVFAAILTLCGCCCVPCIRSLCTRLITTAIQPVKTEVSEMYALLTPQGQPPEDDEEDDAADVASLHFPEMFPDSGNHAN